MYGFGFTASPLSRRNGPFLPAVLALGLGILLGADGASQAPHRVGTPVAAASVPVPSTQAAAPEPPLGRRLGPGLVYPAEVLRVLDGDTFEARVRVWPGLDVQTKVRLRGIDAAELHARCAAEFAQAQAARIALEKLLAEGGVTVWQVGVDKYGGRVDASTATRNTADVAAAMLAGGWARAYGGGRRESWCG